MGSSKPKRQLTKCVANKNDRLGYNMASRSLAESETGDKVVHDADYWHFFGSTESSGKKNDHLFHNAAVNDVIVPHYTKLFEDRGINLESWDFYTDNCGQQDPKNVSANNTMTANKRFIGFVAQDRVQYEELQKKEHPYLALCDRETRRPPYMKGLPNIHEKFCVKATGKQQTVTDNKGRKHVDYCFETGLCSCNCKGCRKVDGYSECQYMERRGLEEHWVRAEKPPTENDLLYERIAPHLPGDKCTVSDMKSFLDERSISYNKSASKRQLADHVAEALGIDQAMEGVLDK